LRWVPSTTLTSARQTKCPYEQKTRVDICFANLFKGTTGSNEQPSTLLALRHWWHRGRRAGHYETVTAGVREEPPQSARASRREERERRNRRPFVACRVESRGHPSRISFPRQRPAGACQSLDAGSGYRVGSRAHPRAHGLSNALGGVDRTPLRAETRARVSASRSPFAEKRTPARHVSDSDRTRGAGEMAGRAPDAGAAEAAVKGSSAAMAEVRARGRADEDPDVSATRTPASGATRRRRRAKTSLRYFGSFQRARRRSRRMAHPFFANSFRGAARDGTARRARTADLSEPYP
jgi:hypothetical protein